MARVGLFFALPMSQEPDVKRAWVFVDGQNIFYAVKKAFGYGFPNYDVAKLASLVCGSQGWMHVGTSFYTGVSDATDNPTWNRF